MSSSFRTENLDAVGRERDHVRQLIDGGEEVISRAIGTLRRRWPVQARRIITGVFNLPADYVRKRLFCTSDDSSVTLTAIGRPVGLSQFNARQTRTGVRAEVRKGSPFEIPHAFIATPGGGMAVTGPQVYIRKDAPYNVPDDVQDTAETSKDRHGYPIERLAGPGVGDMLRDGDNEDQLIDFGQELFADEVDRLTEVARGK
jgi:hypothetical protein